MIWESEFQESERNFDALRRRNLRPAFRAFRKIYLEVIDEIIDDLKSQESEAG
jgi:hypothetical protein